MITLDPPQQKELTGSGSLHPGTHLSKSQPFFSRIFCGPSERPARLPAQSLNHPYTWRLHCWGWALRGGLVSGYFWYHVSPSYMSLWQLPRSIYKLRRNQGKRYICWMRGNQRCTRKTLEIAWATPWSMSPASTQPTIKTIWPSYSIWKGTPRWQMKAWCVGWRWEQRAWSQLIFPSLHRCVCLWRSSLRPDLQPLQRSDL